MYAPREMWRRRYARELLAFSLALGAFAACASDEEGNFFDIGDGVRRDASLQQQPEASPGPGSGGTSQEGTCTPDYCPVIGQGAPCCISSEGPCGMDNGTGCRQPTGSDR